MTTTRRVLLCGKSLLFSGLQASLEATSGVDYLLVDSHPKTIQEAILAWEPEILIVESKFLQSNFSLTLMKSFPHLKLVAVDLEENHLLVFSSRFSDKPTTSDILQVIKGQEWSAEEASTDRVPENNEPVRR